MALIDGVAASDGHSHPLHALYIRFTSELFSNADVSWLDPPTLQLISGPCTVQSARVLLFERHLPMPIMFWSERDVERE